MRFYAIIVVVFTSLYVPSLIFANTDFTDLNTCIFQKTVNLDDKVTSAEIIGKSVIHECEGEIDGMIEEFGKPVYKDQIIEEFTKRATAFVLKNRKDNKLAGVEEEYFIGPWHYTVRSKDEHSKEYQLLQSIRQEGNVNAFIVTCDNSSGTTLKFLVSEYEIQNDAEYLDKDVGPEIIIFPLEIYFDGNSTKPFVVNWFKNNSKHLAQTLGENAHLSIKEMSKFKTMTLVANPKKEPITFDLSRFQEAIRKLDNQCK